jgi:hypothetical protein
MKVWGTDQYWTRVEGKSYQARAVVAAKTKKKAAELLGLSMYMMKNYSSVTGNDKEVAAAMEKPETVVVMETY